MDYEAIRHTGSVIFYTISGEGMPTKDRIQYLAAFFGFFAFIHFMIIGPMIFNWFILKNIQKRLGVMFSYDDLYRQLLYGQNILRQFDASSYIAWQWILKTFRIKIKLSEKAEIVCFQMYFLRRAGFTVEMATKFEVFMSFTVVLSVLYTFIIAPIIWQVAKLFS